MSLKEVDRIIVHNGGQSAVFVKTDEGWRPDWFYVGDCRMLRFKDHEWLSIGHIRPSCAAEAEKLESGGAIFRNTTAYGECPVDWTVRIEPARVSGFWVECCIRPKKSIELLEAYSTFETPYEYDGNEHVTTVIGQNPVVRWRGSERISPPIRRRPEWLYAREEAARRTAPCNTPILCQELSGPGGENARYTTIVGDWNICRIHDVFATPTRFVDVKSGDWGGIAEGELRGYKFIVGALNWSSSFTKDPNVLYRDGEKHCQRVVVDYADDMPGGTLDRMLLAAWERASEIDLPGKGRVPAFNRARKKGVTWESAVSWLRDVFCGDGTEGLFLPEKGIATYAPGTRPKAGHYTWRWWPQWSGHFRYRALVADDEELKSVCDNYDRVFAENQKNFSFGNAGIALTPSALPALQWLSGPGKPGPLAETLEKALKDSLEVSMAENGDERRLDNGAQAATAEGFLFAARAFDDPAFRDQALVLLKEINAELDGRFWAFNCGERGDLMHGGQIRPFGHGHASLANLLAYQDTGEDLYLEAATRFARFLLSINYVTHDASEDPDFDWRGWANGSNAGRDQIAEFPPWETIASLHCITPLLGETEMEDGFYDVLWYIARTGLAQFPAAREFKRIYDESMNLHYVTRDTLESEHDFYDNLPFLAYENPHDQTLLASYQGTDCLMAEMALGGGLVKASDDRLGVIVPGVCLMDSEIAHQRRAHIWNPTSSPVKAEVSPAWPDGPEEEKTVTVPPREAVKLEFSR
ncbi:MAG: hypothetical protein ACLFWL_06615 [Candidatus Brocadiia bacterium]